MAKKPDPLSALLASSFQPSAVKPAPAPETPLVEVAAPPKVPVEKKLPKAAAKVPPQRLEGAEKGTAAPEVKKAAEASLASPENFDFDGVKKTTVSFYAAEQAKVDEILDTLRASRRHRGGFSDAIKIALRLCPIDPVAIGQAWDAARAADKRTMRGKVS